ncbi:MAG: glycerate kinase [Planctomyces sp.]
MDLRADAIQIWEAGVGAADSSRLVQTSVRLHPDRMSISGHEFLLDGVSHIEVVGAGKAGAGMAAGLLEALQNRPATITLSGWVNVPADCVRSLPGIHLHAARPAHRNEPTAEAVRGTREILKRISSLRETDLCIVLLSGGGSALLCLPVPEITLESKLQLTKRLAAAGAPIQDLNRVRTQLSLVKGGRLAHACSAGTLISLIISDVIGDPLSVIASGPTFTESTRTTADGKSDLPAGEQASRGAREALEILARYGLIRNGSVPEDVLNFLTGRQTSAEQSAEKAETSQSIISSDATSPLHKQSQKTTSVHNLIIGNNAKSLHAAELKAQQLGYDIVSLGSDQQGDAAEAGRDLFRRLTEVRNSRRTTGARQRSSDRRGCCILSGGEPTVRLAAAAGNRKGGRNQELILAAIADSVPDSWSGIVMVSGGTDGEDGPTDAAGAFADRCLVEEAARLGVQADKYLAGNDSWHFFDRVGGHIKTGPTHTNVMDLRVGLVEYEHAP